MQLEELVTKVEELKAEVDEKNDEVKNKDATHKAALKAMKDDHKMAMDEKEHEKKAMEDDHKKDKEASYKSMKASLTASMNAMEDENKKEGMKAALKAMDEEHKKDAMYSKKGDMDNPEKYEKNAEDDKKEREHKAEITYLTAQIIKPKINQLETLYKASKISNSEIETFKAEWEKQTGPQLDAEINKMIKIVGNVPMTFEAERTPFGFSTTNSHRTNQFDASTLHDKFSKMTDSELFNTPREN